MYLNQQKAVKFILPTITEIQPALMGISTLVRCRTRKWCPLGLFVACCLTMFSCRRWFVVCWFENGYYVLLQVAAFPTPGTRNLVTFMFHFHVCIYIYIYRVGLVFMLSPSLFSVQCCQAFSCFTSITLILDWLPKTVSGNETVMVFQTPKPFTASN